MNDKALRIEMPLCCVQSKSLLPSSPSRSDCLKNSDLMWKQLFSSDLRHCSRSPLLFHALPWFCSINLSAVGSFHLFLFCTYRMHLPILVIFKSLKRDLLYIYIVSICQENVIPILQIGKKLTNCGIYLTEFRPL